MAITQITDVVVPAEFSQYVIEHSVTSTALLQSGVLVQSPFISAALAAGSNNFNVPFWRDIVDGNEADVTSDDPAVLSVPQKFTSGKQIVRKSFLHASWGAMSLAAELAGSDPLSALQSRVTAYWAVQAEKRLVSTLMGVLASNVANNSSDMVVDISGGTGEAAEFNATAVIQTTATLGDRMQDSIRMICMHSHCYTQALLNDEIEFIPNSQGQPIKTYRGLGVLIDDNLTPAAGVYTTILMGDGAIGYGSSEPNTGFGSEIYRYPDQGRGGGATVLHSRQNMSLHPLGYAWNDGTGGSAIAGESPTIGDLANAAHWTRVVASRKQVPLAFLVSK
jgi:hypothetical protein